MGKRNKTVGKAVKLALGFGFAGALLVLLVLAGRGKNEAGGGDFYKYNHKQFSVHRVIDGDTIDLDVPDGDKAYTRVRLWGVDTPETKAPGKPVAYFGPEASAFTERMVANKTITLELLAESTRGKFGRVLGYVYTQDNKMLNEELLINGYAYADDRWSHRFRTRFSQAEKVSRKNKRGLWQDVSDEDMPKHVRQRLALEN